MSSDGTAADGETDESTLDLDYPDMATEPDEGTDWELTERVIGMPEGGRATDSPAAREWLAALAPGESPPQPR